MPFTLLLWADLRSEHTCSLSSFQSDVLLVLIHSDVACLLLAIVFSPFEQKTLQKHVNVKNNMT